MVNIILHGCNGRMGRMITDLVKDDPDAGIAAGVDVAGGRLSDFPVFEDIKDCDIKGDVVIDFGIASAVGGVIDYCVKNSIPLVECTTGLSDEDTKKLSEASKEIAVLKSSNMSLGVNVINKVLSQISRVLLESGFDAEIVEKHHRMKLDAPSGTALSLADSINSACGDGLSYVYDRSGVRQKRSDKEIGISAVRGGTIVGDHDVIFAGQDEVITISHRAYSRAIFAKGAIKAAMYLKDRAAGYYTMSDVIG
ncbi:MAG TPA: 4-hydroxy-tetrahydrodipicolinate reductase [Lachnospiraceae bacterium]|nr:4-hydroxy-tetrahydrodipicolinate reductase [Lachnospiraceae bacterium]